MSNFAAADAVALFSALESHALKLGVFKQVGTHEPENPPPRGPSCSIILESIRPAPSGLAATSARLTFIIRIYSSLRQRPLDPVDPAVLGAASVLVGEYNGAFTLAGTVRSIEVLASDARMAYVQDFEGEPFRVMDITLPITINDLWTQVA